MQLNRRGGCSRWRVATSGFLGVLVLGAALLCTALTIDLVRRAFDHSPFFQWSVLLWSCPRQPGPTGGTTTFLFDADYAVLTYRFTDGLDLDTRTRMVSPHIASSTGGPMYIGWGREKEIPNQSNRPIVKWGLDNQKTGVEAALIDLKSLKAHFPNAEEIVIDCRGFWYRSVGNLPVKIEAVFYRGGAMVPVAFGFENPTAIENLKVASAEIPITLKATVKATHGERIATFRYNLRTKIGRFDTHDVTTP